MDNVTNEDILTNENNEEAEVQKETENINSEIQELKDQLIRLQADFTNFRNRTKKEAQNSVDLGVEKLAIKLFSVIDNFENAIKQMDDSPYKEGFEMIYNQLIEILESEDIKQITINESNEFDPNLHHAVTLEEIEGMDNNKVIEILVNGYTKNDKTLRPAMVKVSK